MIDNPLKVYKSVLEMIGKTPLVKLNRVPQMHGVKCQIWGKVEGTNPGGSIKDRIGLNMIEKAEERGELKEGNVIVESTSGNTGMGLALTSCIKGYKTIITIPDKMSLEKINRLKAVNSEVHICPTELDHHHPESYTGKAHEISKRDNIYYPNQYEN